MKNPFQRSYSDEELAVFAFLSRVKLFEQLTHEEMTYFLPDLYLRKYKEEEVVFFRKDPSQAIYLIKKGKISLLMDLGNSFEQLNQLNPEDSFGNNALLPGTHRGYNAVVTSSEAELYVIPRVNILDIFDSQLRVKAKMLSSLSTLYNDYTLELINAYRSSKGFFSLNNVPINF